MVVTCEILLLRHSRGELSVLSVYLFAIASVAGYRLLVAVAWPLGPGEGTRVEAMLLTGAMHFFAIGAAFEAAGSLARIDSWLAWLVVGGVSIVISLGVAHSTASRSGSRRPDSL